jgi:hypothetical protein
MKTSNTTEIIDEKIKDLVIILNQLDIPTTGSCQGHIEYGAPAPWIKITPPKENDGRVKNKMAKLLETFYKDHSPEKDARFIIENANFGFWIHNGGTDYDRWRAEVNERARSHGSEKEIHESISSQEKESRAKTLPIYQNEISFLVSFLKKIGKES